MDPMKDIDLATTPLNEMTDDSLIYWAKHTDRLLGATRWYANFLEGHLGDFLAETQKRGITDRIIDAKDE